MAPYAGRTVDARVDGTATRVAGILLPVSGGITVLGALLLTAVAVLGAGLSFLALLSLGCGLLQIVLGIQRSAAQDGDTGDDARRPTVYCCLASSFVAVLLLPVGSGATVVAALLPLVVVALLLAGDAPRTARTVRRTLARAAAVRRSRARGGSRTRP